MLLGYSDEQSLRMPARRFFAVLAAAQDIEHEKRMHEARIRNSMLLDLVDIAWVPSSSFEWQKELKKVLQARIGINPYPAPTAPLKPASNRAILARFDAIQRGARGGR